MISDEAPSNPPKAVPEMTRGKLQQRRLPKLNTASTGIEAFEARLALSVNPGADLLIEMLGGFDHGQCVPVQPASSEAADFQQAVQTPEFSALNSDGDVVNLFDQAADVRANYNLTGAGQTIAVIDSGIAWDHVALGEGFGAGYRVVGGWDFAENDSDPYDDAPAGFHGTHVSGIIGGDEDGKLGIAPEADLVGLRVFNDFGRSSMDWIESALQWVYDNRDAFEHPITTVNMSIGAMLGDDFSPDAEGQLEDELQLLRGSGIVVVAAAGNQFDSSHPDRLNYPASSSLTWAVASSDGDDGLSSFSQRTASILAAPGERINSAIPDHLLGRDGLVNDYYTASGTSMSAPQVAAASMLVRQALEQAGETATPDSIHRVLTETANHQIDPITGREFFAVNLSSAIASILDPVEEHPGSNNPSTGESGNEANDINWRTPRELGLVRLGQADLDYADGVRVTAAQEGLFSIRSEQQNVNAIIRVTDAEGQALWHGKLPDTGQLDIPVNSGQQLVIHAADSDGNDPLTLLLANVFDFDSDSGRVQIDTGNDSSTVSVDLQNGFNASIGEFQYVIGVGQVTSGSIDGGSGADRLEIQGSAATSRIILNPYADGSLSEGNMQLALRGFENVVFTGGGGADRAYLYDTRGDDLLTARPGYAKLEGVGFQYEVFDIARSYVHATSGGQDIAFLHDSSGDDSLAVRPQFVSLRGNGFFNSAIGFEKVYAYSTAGGYDRADLYDSAGNDRMSASASSALITSSGYYAQARGFDSVTAHSTAGGIDTATLYADDSGTTRWIRTSDQLTLRTLDGSERTARGFDSVQSFESGVPINTSQVAWNPLSLAEAIDNASSSDGAMDNYAHGSDIETGSTRDMEESSMSPGGVQEGFMAQFRRRERDALDTLFGYLGEDEDEES